MLFTLEELSWTELDRIERDRALILIPVSPIEEHGPHLPLGTDIMAATDIARQTAQRLDTELPDHQVVLAPAIPLGCAAVTADFPGTQSLRGTTLKNVICDIGLSWVRHGFRHLLFCNHHLDPIHMKAILTAIQEIESQYPARIAETMSRCVYAGLATAIDAEGRRMGLDMRYEIHADAKETAYIRFRRPDLVKRDVAALEPVRIDIVKGMRGGHTTFKEMGAKLGYIGSPGHSDPAFGRLHLETCVHQAVELAKKLLNGDPLPVIDPRMEAFLNQDVQLD